MSNQQPQMESTGTVYVSNASGMQLETNRSGFYKLFALAHMGGFALPEVEESGSPNAMLDMSADGLMTMNTDACAGIHAGLKQMYSEVPDEQVSPDQIVHAPPGMDVDEALLSDLVNDLRTRRRAQGYPESKLQNIRAAVFADFEFGPNPPDILVIRDDEEDQWYEPPPFYWAGQMKSLLGQFIDLFEDAPVTLSQTDLRPTDARVRDGLAGQERIAQQKYIDENWGLFAATAETGYKKAGRGVISVEFINGRPIEKMTLEEELDALVDPKARFMLAYMAVASKEAPEMIHRYNPAREIVVMFRSCTQIGAPNLFRIGHPDANGQSEPLWKAARDFKRKLRGGGMEEIATEQEIDQAWGQMSKRERRFIKDQLDAQDGGGST